MAQQGVQLHREQLSCSICLDLLKDPVTVPCGHNYCSRCIERCWNQGDQRGRRFSCPQCRHTFITRPVLMKNTMLAEVVESLKKTELQDVPPDHCYAGPGDVACDVCTGRRLKAVKTCLQCLISYCDTHLQPHHQFPAFKKHKLVKASSELTEGGTHVSETWDTRLRVHALLSTPAEPKTRADFLQYSRPSSTSSTSKQHMNIHTGVKPFSCTVCGNSFSHKISLAKHMRIHTREKPFSCTVCESSFSLNENLKRHMRIHTGEKPFSCTVCGISFSQMSSLKKHMMIHTGEKPYSCTVCDNRFSRTHSLKLHMKIHTGGKP